MISRCAVLACLLGAVAAKRPSCTHFRELFPGRVVHEGHDYRYQPEACDLNVPEDAGLCIAKKSVVFVGDEVLQKSAWQIANHSSMERGTLEISECDNTPLDVCRKRSALYETKAGGTLAFVWTPSADADGALIDKNVEQLLAHADVVVLGGAVHRDAAGTAKALRGHVDLLTDRVLYVKGLLKQSAQLSLHTSHALHLGKDPCMQMKTQAFAAVHEYLSNCAQVPVFNSYRLTKFAAVGYTHGAYVHDTFLPEADVLLAHICTGMQLPVSQRKCSEVNILKDHFSLQC